MIPDILIALVTVGLAELGDKTQLAVFCLASRTKKYLQLLLGVTLGFAIAGGLAIILGDFLATLIPSEYIKIGAGVIFILFGILTLLKMAISMGSYMATKINQKVISIIAGAIFIIIGIGTLIGLV